MAHSTDLRWRAVSLVYIYSLPVDDVCAILGLSKKSVQRWYKAFEETGTVAKSNTRITPLRWPPAVYDFTKDFIKDHPCFYLEELQVSLTEAFPDVGNISISTICRALRHDLNVTKKVLCKMAREAIPLELEDYYNRLLPFYKYSEQLIFIDETSKDGRDAVRSRAWSPRGQRAIVSVPFGRGSRVSVLAAFGSKGFMGWKIIDGTFTRQVFHDAFVENVFPLLNPWPLPHSIVVMDNARIHMYPALERVISQAGALLFYLPPYSPQLNPIELGFGLLKRWIQKHAFLAFQHNPEAVLNIAFRKCMDPEEHNPVNLYDHCGYSQSQLKEAHFFKE
jgi:hypothetical protein